MGALGIIHDNACSNGIYEVYIRFKDFILLYTNSDSLLIRGLDISFRNYILTIRPFLFQRIESNNKQIPLTFSENVKSTNAHVNVYRAVDLYFCIIVS